MGFLGVAQGLHRYRRKFGTVPQGVWEMNLGMVLFEAGQVARLIFSESIKF